MKMDLTGICAQNIEFLQWPRVLLIHLKRWRYNEFTKTCQKTDEALHCPARYTPTKDVIYNLRSMVVHVGIAGSGHYVANARDDGQGWLHYNDAAAPVKQDEETVQRQAA